MIMLFDAEREYLTHQRVSDVPLKVDEHQHTLDSLGFFFRALSMQ